MKEATRKERHGSSSGKGAPHTIFWAGLLAVVMGCGGSSGGGGGGIGLEDLNSDGQIVVLCFGDSITRGTGDGPVAQQTPPLPSGYPARLQSLLGVPVVNAGVPGERTREGIRRLPTELSRSNPDYVILLEGTNDLQEGRGNEALVNLENMVDDVFAAGAFPILGTLPPGCCNHRNSLRDNWVRFYNDQVRRIAFDESIPVIDFFGAFVTASQPDETPPEEGETQSFDPESGLLHRPEGLHPTPAGYDLMAETASILFLERVDGPPVRRPGT